MYRSIVLLIVLVLALSTIIELVDNRGVLRSVVAEVVIPMKGVTVLYLPPMIKDVSVFKIVVENSSGARYPTVLSMYVWMPNGSLVEVGKFFDRYGEIVVASPRLAKAFEEWCTYLEKLGNDPDLIGIGIIVMATVHTQQGVYSIIRSVPIHVSKIALEKRSVEIRIVEDLGTRKPLVSGDELRTLAKEILEHGYPMKRIEIAEWLPKEIDVYCDEVCEDDCVYMCVFWDLEKVYASKQNTVAPIEIVYLHGESHKVSNVFLLEMFRTSSSRGIQLSFSATAAIMHNAEVSYEIVGSVVVLEGDNTWLYHDAYLRNGAEFHDDAILAIGIRGDMALARYRLAYCYIADYWSEWVCGYLDSVANITLFRPVIVNNKMIPWTGVDNDPDVSDTDLDRIVELYQELWKPSRLYERVDNHLTFEWISIVNDLRTKPMFSASIAVLPILLATEPVSVVLAPTFGVAVGLTQLDPTLQELEAVVGIKAEYANAVFRARYFYSPSKLMFEGNEYYVGSMYLDVEID